MNKRFDLSRSSAPAGRPGLISKSDKDLKICNYPAAMAEAAIA
jgi:hypothetical protein